MSSPKVNEENFSYTFLQFQERQAGVSLVFCPEEEMYTYNVYCVETKLMKELFSVECTFLDEALDLLDSEFGTWDINEVKEKESGCSTCVAK